MTFGKQNSPPQAFFLLDQAFDVGISFFDSEEMYPVPQRAETQGRSEEYFGRWVRERKILWDKIVFATKVSVDGVRLPSTSSSVFGSRKIVRTVCVNNKEHASGLLSDDRDGENQDAIAEEITP